MYDPLYTRQLQKKEVVKQAVGNSVSPSFIFAVVACEDVFKVLDIAGNAWIVEVGDDNVPFTVYCDPLFGKATRVLPRR